MYPLFFLIIMSIGVIIIIIVILLIIVQFLPHISWVKLAAFLPPAVNSPEVPHFQAGLMPYPDATETCFLVLIKDAVPSLGVNEVFKFPSLPFFSLFFYISMLKRIYNFNVFSFRSIFIYLYLKNLIVT